MTPELIPKYSYCTLFDSPYLSKGIAMYESLKEHTSDFHLYIFAFDEMSDSILRSLSLEKVTVISLAEFETPELLQIKTERSKAEYCWTCTPSVISYVLKNYNTIDCTYIDSDLYFYSDPVVLLSELVEFKKNVLITEHRYSLLPKLYEEKRAGRFCVQFMTFRNEPDSLKVLDTWRKQCIEWCYARHEDGKFGDQKYLDSWPSAYNNVHILQHQGGGIAPWNLLKYRFKQSGNYITGKVKKSGVEFKVVFFHFQFVKFLKHGSFNIGWYIIPSYLKKLFYQPYISKVSGTETKIMSMNPSYRRIPTSSNNKGVKNIFKSVLKSIFSYNIIEIDS